MREEQVADRLGQVLKDIYVPEGVANQIVSSLNSDLDRSEHERKSSFAALQQRLTVIQTRMDQMYEDKLDGISAKSYGLGRTLSITNRNEPCKPRLNVPVSLSHPYKR